MAAKKKDDAADAPVVPHKSTAHLSVEDRFATNDLYDKYACTIRVREKLCGGVPRNPDLLKGWITATTEHDDELSTQQEKDAREAILAPTEEKSWNGFRGHPELGLFLEARQVKALFKECATMLRVTVKKRGSTQIFQHGFEIKGNPDASRVYLGKKAPDGYLEGPIHVQTAQGPRTAIKRVDYVEGADISFEIWVLHTEGGEKRHVGEEDLVRMLSFGQENGLGADRSQGHGKFSVVKFERIK